VEEEVQEWVSLEYQGHLSVMIEVMAAPMPVCSRVAFLGFLDFVAMVNS
jgi:hypothetical protein